MKNNTKTSPKKKIECLLEWIKDRKIQQREKDDEK